MATETIPPATPGDATSLTDQIPWLITSDLQLVVLLTGTEGTKETMTLAEVFCWITKIRGATEAVMLDHNVSPLLKEKIDQLLINCFKCFGC